MLLHLAAIRSAAAAPRCQRCSQSPNNFNARYSLFVCAVLNGPLKISCTLPVCLSAMLSSRTSTCVIWHCSPLSTRHMGLSWGQSHLRGTLHYLLRSGEIVITVFRATLSLPFPSSTSSDVAIEMMAFRPAASAVARRSLHVQSISSWAAACIGPYSQSITAGGLCFLSGQIGLVPATMQLASPPVLSHVTDTNALLHDPRRALAEVQLDEALRNLRAVLSHHGLGSSDCLSLNCYYVDTQGKRIPRGDSHSRVCQTLLC
jgi:enamine deaminase RidA (YjgF/YER057c/UK114 family)